jgi:hypothetical protein
MTHNSSNPETSTAVVEGGARKSDQLASEIASENNVLAAAVNAIVLDLILGRLDSIPKYSGTGFKIPRRTRCERARGRAELAAIFCELFGDLGGRHG